MEHINFDFEVLVVMETSTVVYVLVVAYGTDRQDGQTVSQDRRVVSSERPLLMMSYVLQATSATAAE
jgi:hypothetical protein